ncbi:hypothetical protein NRB20_20320 [Nocardia sp. RB20]|uniref:Uncharacterized protein n=1 Tax=Nocardia macrotermitis TaxID=2585198 RepID=A0A7K0CZR6_9NOCA|nr:hypothetical protein [Nocardia macrotermitis]
MIERCTRCGTCDGVDRVLNIHQVSARTGDSIDRIRHLRVAGHELYSQAWKSGDSPNAPLRLEQSKVEAWVSARRQAGSRGLS